ncbi:MAG TPA: AAA family ATPase [Candidatus Limnocylindrales bacterium]|nr:AAA family ATPase [Candidatus Limnocylindrales bacterium]
MVRTMVQSSDPPSPGIRLAIAPDALVVLVGAAGSGKSTLAARLFPADAILSSDALRAALSGDPANQAATRLAFRILHEQAARRLAAGQLTVVDATNVEASARRPLRRLAQAAGRPVVAIVLDLPPATCLARNAARTERIVPAAAVLRQLAALRRSLDRDELAAEGYDQLIVVADPGWLDSATIGETKPGGAATLGRSTLGPSALPRRSRRSKP